MAADIFTQLPHHEKASYGPVLIFFLLRDAFLVDMFN